MKKLIITLIILILWTSKGISQNSNDSSTLIPNTQLRKAINLIENSKVIKKELDLVNEKYVLLEYRLFIKDSIISEFEKKEGNWIKIDSLNKSQIFNYKQVIDNQDKMCKIYANKLHRQKLKNLFMLISIIGLGAVLSK